MSESHFPVTSVMALQAATALARYDRHVRMLAATWLDMELYSIVSEDVDEVRRCCEPVPELGLASTRLLLSHAELIHELWRSGQREGMLGNAEINDRLHEHLACIEAVARRCRRIAHRSGTRAA